MVLPSELLHILHADSLRTFLTDQCEKIFIIDPQQLWFENTLQGAILLMAEKKVEVSEKSKGVGIYSTNSKSILKSDPEFLFQKADYDSLF